MDPPPQAHIGVGHDPEYSMPPNSGQPSVTPWTEGVEARGRRTPAAFGEQARRGGGVASEGMRSARPESPAGHWVGSRGVACGALGWLTRSRLRGTGLAQAESPAGHWVGTRGVACEAWGRRGREPPPQGAFRACSGRVRGVGSGRAAAQIGGVPEQSSGCAASVCRIGARAVHPVRVGVVPGPASALWESRVRGVRSVRVGLRSRGRGQRVPDRSPCCVPGACGSRPGCSVGVVGVAGARCPFRAGRPPFPRAWSACAGSEPVLCTRCVWESSRVHRRRRGSRGCAVCVPCGSASVPEGAVSVRRILPVPPLPASPPVPPPPHRPAPCAPSRLPPVAPPASRRPVQPRPPRTGRPGGRR